MLTFGTFLAADVTALLTVRTHSHWLCGCVWGKKKKKGGKKKKPKKKKKKKKKKSKKKDHSKEAWSLREVWLLDARIQT